MISIVVYAYIVYPLYYRVSLIGPGTGLVFLIEAGTVIFSIPSVIGAVLLLQRRRSGVAASLAALILATLFSFYISASTVLSGAQAGVPLLGLTAIMYVFLIIGWKRVQWR